ncbi:MAG: SAM-dependent methyltransferase [Alphaproteobacteria bacterium]|nr:SAM-dependent methyltransferase [Alphaproteobacteria bacterium]
MTLTLDKVIIRGRTFDEYTGMFALSEDDLNKRILDCGGGAASFNALLSKRGGRVVSIDPLYRLTSEEIAAHAEEAHNLIIEQMRKSKNDYVWTTVRSFKELEMLRQSAVQDFLADYMQGKKENRYIVAELPNLPFGKQEFGLALCSHFLLHYAEQFNLGFHMQSFRELSRVADEVRTYPLLEYNTKRCRYLDDIVSGLSSEGYDVAIKPVPYELIKGANEMLVVRPSRGSASDAPAQKKLLCCP